MWVTSNIRESPSANSVLVSHLRRGMNTHDGILLGVGITSVLLLALGILWCVVRLGQRKARSDNFLNPPWQSSEQERELVRPQHQEVVRAGRSKPLSRWKQRIEARARVLMNIVPNLPRARAELAVYPVELPARSAGVLEGRFELSEDRADLHANVVPELAGNRELALRVERHLLLQRTNVPTPSSATQP